MDLLTLLGGKQSYDDVPIEHLDYSYVENCDKVEELKAILSVLKSGKEGYYPQLEKATEERIMSLLPTSEMRKIERLRAGPTDSDFERVQGGFTAWRQNIGKVDETLKATSKGKIRQELAPVRGSSTQKREDNPADAAGSVFSERCGSRVAENNMNLSNGTKQDQQKNNRISGYDFRAWEKFDVEKAIEEVDEEDKKLSTVVSEQQKRQKEEEMRRAKELKALPSRVDLSQLSEVEKQLASQKERQKGNEWFKSGDTEKAEAHYSRAIALFDQDAAVYANRALCGIKLENFAQAEADCDRALELDPNYVKAWARRGVVMQKRGRYRRAIEDFEKALQLEPENKSVTKLLEETRKKEKEVGGGVDAPIAKKFIGNNTDKEQQISKNTKFRRIEILEDEDSAGSEDEELQQKTEASKFRRIEILDDEDSAGAEEGEEADQRQKPEASKFRKIEIVEEDEGTTSTNSESMGKDQRIAGMPVADACGGQEQNENTRNVADIFSESSSARKKRDRVPEQERQEQEQSAHTGFRRIAIEIESESDDDDHNDDDDEEEERAQKAVGQQQNQERQEEGGLKIREEGGKGDRIVTGFKKDHALELREEEKEVSTLAKSLQLKSQGNAAATDGRPAEAIARYSEALNALLPAESPSSPSLPCSARDREVSILYSNRAACRLSLQQLEDALSDCSEALRWNGQNDKARLRRALAFEKLGHLREAFEDLQLLIRKDQIIDSKDEGVCTREEGAGPLLRRNAVSGKDEGLYREDKGTENTDKQIEREAESRGEEADSKDGRVGDQDVEVARHQIKEQARSMLPAVRRALAEKLRNEGNQAFGKGDLASAVTLYTESSELDPECVKSLCNRALVYNKQERFAEAAQDCGKVLAKEKRNVKALFRRAVALKGLGKLDESKKDLERLLAEEPRNSPAKKELKAVEALLSRKFGLDTKGARENDGPRIEIISEVRHGPDQLDTATFRCEEKTMIQEEDEERAKDKGDRSGAGEVNTSAEISGEVKATKRVDTTSSSSLRSEGSAAKIVPTKKRGGPTMTKLPKVQSKNFRVPRSSTELEMAWRSLNRDTQEFAEYLKKIPPKTYSALFKHSLNSEILSSILFCMDKHICREDAVFTLRMLQEIPNVKRFSVARLFLTEQDKQALSAIFSTLEKKEDFVAAEELLRLRQLWR